MTHDTCLRDFERHPPKMQQIHKPYVLFHKLQVFTYLHGLRDQTTSPLHHPLYRPSHLHREDKYNTNVGVKMNNLETTTGKSTSGRRYLNCTGFVGYAEFEFEIN